MLERMKLDGEDRIERDEWKEWDLKEMGGGEGGGRREVSRCSEARWRGVTPLEDRSER